MNSSNNNKRDGDGDGSVGAAAAAGAAERPTTAEDPAKLLAIEMGALADSVAVDLIVDTKGSQLDREQRFNMTGKTKSFAKVEPGCYVSRVFLYHSDGGIADMGPAPEPPLPEVDEAGYPMVQTYGENGELIATSFEVGGVWRNS